RIEEAERDLEEAQTELENARILAGTRAQELKQAQLAADARVAALAGSQQAILDLAAQMLLAEPAEPGAEPVLLAASFLFDLPFYNRQLPRPMPLADALRHYLDEGEAKGLLPNALFDTA